MIFAELECDRVACKTRDITTVHLSLEVYFSGLTTTDDTTQPPRTHRVPNLHLRLSIEPFRTHILPAPPSLWSLSCSSNQSSQCCIASCLSIQPPRTHHLPTLHLRLSIEPLRTHCPHFSHAVVSQHNLQDPLPPLQPVCLHNLPRHYLPIFGINSLAPWENVRRKFYRKNLIAAAYFVPPKIRACA